MSIQRQIALLRLLLLFCSALLLLAGILSLQFLPTIARGPAAITLVVALVALVFMRRFVWRKQERLLLRLGVRMMVGSRGTCQHCGAQFSYRLVHCGFGDSSFAYCDTCGRTALFSHWTKTPYGIALSYGTVPREAESLIAACQCGGRFRVDASPRCPHCHYPLSAEAAAAYIERNALGTARGWRWQRSWNGLYALVIEGRSVNDPWRPVKA